MAACGFKENYEENRNVYIQDLPETRLFFKRSFLHHFLGSRTCAFDDQWQRFPESELQVDFEDVAWAWQLLPQQFTREH